MIALEKLRELPELVARFWTNENRARLEALHTKIQQVGVSSFEFVNTQKQDMLAISQLIVDLVLDVGFNQRGRSLNAAYPDALYDTLKTMLEITD